MINIESAIGGKSISYFSALIAFLFFSTFSLAQNLPDSSRFVEIHLSIQKAQYDESLALIREEFEKYEKIPAELIYLYGRSLYGNEEYVQAKKAFQEYIRLNEAENLYYINEARTYLSKISQKICSRCENSGTYLAKANCGKCIGTGKLTNKCAYCGEKGTLICKTCKGKGVIIQNSDFGKSFTQCPECTGNGFVSCNRCLGDGVLEQNCDICDGKGKVPTPTPCDHTF